MQTNITPKRVIFPFIHPPHDQEAPNQVRGKVIIQGGRLFFQIEQPGRIVTTRCRHPAQLDQDHLLAEQSPEQWLQILSKLHNHKHSDRTRSDLLSRKLWILLRLKNARESFNPCRPNDTNPNRLQGRQNQQHPQQLQTPSSQTLLQNP